MQTDSEETETGLLHDIRERWYDLEDRYYDLQDRIVALAHGTVENTKRAGAKAEELVETVSVKFEEEPIPFFLAAFAVGGILGLIFTGRRKRDEDY